MMDLVAVRAAVQKAQRVLFQTQHDDGSWDWPNDLGDFVTAQALVALKFVGRLDPADARDGAKYLASRLLPDGSVNCRPFAVTGSLGPTASAWAAFHACGDEASAARTRAWVEAHGGVPAVIALIAQGDSAALFLAMEGLAAPADLPAPPLFLSFLDEILEKRFNTGVLMAMAQNGALTRYLRGDWGAHGDQRGWLASLECKRALKLIEQYQNPSGSFNDNSAQQVTAIPALVALGVGADDGRLTRAIDWLLGQRVRGDNGLWFASFASAIWVTALAVRGLIHSGVPRDDEHILKALDWLAKAQARVAMPAPSQPRKGAPMTGGYAFETGGNVTMPDCDDTGIALGGMGCALASSGDHAVPAERAEPVRQACERARDWLYGMQNADGGWPGYQWGLPGKPKGPLFDKPIVIPINDPLAMGKLFLDPPVELGDPAAEDVTARVLYGLGQLGETADAPQVAQALAFLEKQQLDDGSWWGHWMINYNAATSCVLQALSSIGADLQSPMARRAVQFLVAHQNADGGWGESVDTYAHPERAGHGPSMPPLTGMVVFALVGAGEGGSEAVARGVDYLVQAQRTDGTWANVDWLHCYMPPESFYYLPAEPLYYPLEALGQYLAFAAGRDVTRAGDESKSSLLRGEAPDDVVGGVAVRGPDGGWDPDFLRSMRKEGDALADAVIEQIFGGGNLGAVNQVLAQISCSDDPIPPGLPQAAVDYFQQTAALPAWADRHQIAVAEALWTRCGWQAATGLFCSSLPQAYAAQNGARVLLGTGGMTFHVERRIFETAQFLFDVLDRDALGPIGRGVRAAQKVRLLHAAIRHLTLQQASWDIAWGVPINQEDLAGTLMTFSCVILDALKTLRVPVSREESEAYLHHWRVVGHLMGVDTRLLPRDVADGQALMEAIRCDQWRGSDEGKRLAGALVTFMQKYLPGPALDGLPITLMRDLAGDHCCDLLSLPRADWTRRIVHGAEGLDHWLGLDRWSVTAKLMAEASHHIMKGLVDAFRDGKQTKFRIPDALVHAWNLND